MAIGIVVQKIIQTELAEYEGDASFVDFARELILAAVESFLLASELDHLLNVDARSVSFALGVSTR